MVLDQENKKQLASEWFRGLRDNFCSQFEAIDGKKFVRKKWSHSGEGGGEISVMKGSVFEVEGFFNNFLSLLTYSIPKEINILKRR